MVGEYFANHGNPASQLGFYSGGRVLNVFTATQDTVVLRSTAGKIIDDWSFKNTTRWKVETNGGGGQYFIPKSQQIWWK